MKLLTLILTCSVLLLSGCNDQDAVKLLDPKDDSLKDDSLDLDLVSILQEPAGTNCSNGGSRVDSGADDNADNILQTEEIETTEFFCHGDNGLSGQDGSLINISIEAAGSNCNLGGSKVETGSDDNNDGILQITEIDHTSYLCHQHIAPLANDDQAVLFTQNGSVTIPVLNNDQAFNQETLSITFVGTAANATITQNSDNTLTVSTTESSGNLSFDYTISNGYITSTATVTVMITVQPTVDSFDVSFDETLNQYQLLASVICSDCHTVEYAWQHFNANTLNATGAAADLQLDKTQVSDGSLLELQMTPVNIDGIKGPTTVQNYQFNLLSTVDMPFNTPATFAPPVPNGTVLYGISTRHRGFFAIREDGALAAWGAAGAAEITDSATQAKLDGSVPIVDVVSNGSSSAALLEDGSVVTWGSTDISQNAAEVDGSTNKKVTQLKVLGREGSGRIVAIREDGALIFLGDGVIPYESTLPGVADRINGTNADNTTVNKVVDIVSNMGSGGLAGFAALREDGSVVTWGNASFAGADLTTVNSQLDGTLKVVDLGTWSTKWTAGGFYAVFEDGSLTTWGKNASPAVDTSGVASAIDGTIDIEKVFIADFLDGTFNTANIVALRENNSIVSWGSHASLFNAVASELDGTVPATEVFRYKSNWAVLRNDGSVITWGPDLTVAAPANALDGTIDVVNIFNSPTGFAALRADGSLITWGSTDYSALAAKVDGTIDVANVVGDAIVRADGSVVTFSGNTEIENQLNGTINVTQAFTSAVTPGTSSVVLLEDGSVVAWGHSAYGGDTSEVADQLDGSIRVNNIFIGLTNNKTVYAALREDGSIVTWGDIATFGTADNVQLDKMTLVPVQ